MMHDISNNNKQCKTEHIRWIDTKNALSDHEKCRFNSCENGQCYCAVCGATLQMQYRATGAPCPACLLARADAGSGREFRAPRPARLEQMLLRQWQQLLSRPGHVAAQHHTPLSGTGARHQAFCCQGQRKPPAPPAAAVVARCFLARSVSILGHGSLRFFLLTVPRLHCGCGRPSGGWGGGRCAWGGVWGWEGLGWVGWGA